MKHFHLHDVLRMPQQEHATTGFEYFSLADAGNYEEEIIEGYRGDIDANAALPPLPHDVYCTRVKYADKWPKDENGVEEILAEDPARRWRKAVASDGQGYYCTWIVTTTENNAEPSNDGRESREFLSTYAMKRGTTSVQALLQGLGIDTMTLGSHQAQMIAVDKAIAGEGALAGVELDWEATVFDKEMVQRDKSGNSVKDGNGNDKKGVELFRLRGMKRFPQDAEGNYIAELTEKDGHSYKLPDGTTTTVKEARARNFRRRWVPIAKLTQATQLETTLAASVEQAQAGKPAQTGQQRPVAQPAQQQAQQAPAAPARTAAAPARPGTVRRVTA